MRPPLAWLLTCRRHHVRPTVHLLVASIPRQEVLWFIRHPRADPRRLDAYQCHRHFVASTSAFGIGQVRDSRQTPLGLHRISVRIGDGWPVGTAFRARQPVGYVWDGLPQATIAHRILWLEGLEPGFNQGGLVDTRSRFIYIHGLADEPTLGRPASHGCIHLAASHLIPLFDRLPLRTLVWITRDP